MAVPKQAVPQLCKLLRPMWPRYCSRRAFLNVTVQLTSRQMAEPDYESFCRYEGGRWLWAEEERLQERYKRFSVPGLKAIAAKACGARSCLSITKLAEGGFNKVFRLCMDDGSAAIARISHPDVGPASTVLPSEVATMDFVSRGYPTGRLSVHR